MTVYILYTVKCITCNASTSCSKFLPFTEKPPKETKPKKAAKPKKKLTDDSEDDKPKKATKKRPAKNFSDSDFSEDDFLPKKAGGGKKVGENRTFSDFLPHQRGT